MKIGSRTRPDRPRPRKTWKTGRKPRKPRNNKIDLFLRRPTFSRPTFKETCVDFYWNIEFWIKTETERGKNQKQ